MKSRLTALGFALLTCACGVTATAPVMGGSPVTIADPKSYVQQARCLETNSPAPGCTGTLLYEPAMDTAFVRKHDWPGPGDAITGYQASDAFVPAGVQNEVVQSMSFAPFRQFSAANGDVGQVIVIEGPVVRFTQTQDGGTVGMQYFVGPACGGTGWVAFHTDAVSDAWTDMVATLGDQPSPFTCPPLNAAYTRWRHAVVSVPWRWNGGPTQAATIDTIVSEHYDADSIANAHALERFYFGQAWGNYRWEAWQLNPVTVGNGLPERCPPIDFSTAPAPGWKMVDCRMWTNLWPDTSWTFGSYGWP